MLRKRTRSHHKDQTMGRPMSDAVSESYFNSDVLTQEQKNGSFFNVPSLFIRFNHKGPESDSVRSPTSPLDFRVFSNLGNPFRSPRSSVEGNQKSWNGSKVGLSIIDSLDEGTNQTGIVLRSSESKSILLGPQVRIKTQNVLTRTDSFEAPKSLPNSIFPRNLAGPSNVQKGDSDVLLETGKGPSEHELLGIVGSCSFNSESSCSNLTGSANCGLILNHGNFSSVNGTSLVSSPPKFSGGSSPLDDPSSGKLNIVPTSITAKNGFACSIPASEIQLSEDYTCVRTYGPNAKTTHIFGDCILECHGNELTSDLSKNSEETISASPVGENYEGIPSYPSSNFLSFCYACQKKLDGEDIYVYRGEKAFCSSGCRSQEILLDEALEENNNEPRNSINSSSRENLAGSSLFIPI